MRIDSGLSGYSYHGRIYQIDRDTEETTAREPAPAPRSPASPAFSSTLLSASLSRALWVIDGGKNDDAAAKEVAETNFVDHVQALYLEHTDLDETDLH